jgi:hypothetical protein
MTDTSPEVEARLDALFARRSGSDKVLMVCEMFDFARMLVVADVKARCPDISDTELRVKIFERTYGDDVDPETRARVIARLRGGPAAT